MVMARYVAAATSRTTATSTYRITAVAMAAATATANFKIAITKPTHEDCSNGCTSGVPWPANHRLAAPATIAC